MKKTIIRIVAVAMLALMVLTALPAFAYNIVGTAAAQTPVYKDTKGRKVELYVSGPVTINRQDNKSGMYNVTVSYDGKTYTGWVYPSAISGIGYDKSTGGSASGSTSGTSGGTAGSTGGTASGVKMYDKAKSAVSKDNNIYVRSTATSSTKGATKLRNMRGKTFTVLGTDASGSFLYADYNGTRGFVRAQDFTFTSGNVVEQKPNNNTGTNGGNVTSNNTGMAAIGTPAGKGTGSSSEKWGSITIPGAGTYPIYGNYIGEKKGKTYYYYDYVLRKSYYYVHTTTAQGSQVAVVMGHNNRKKVGTSNSYFHNLHHIQNAILGKSSCEKCKASCSGYGKSISASWEGSSSWEVVAFFEVPKNKAYKNILPQMAQPWNYTTAQYLSNVKSYVNTFSGKSWANTSALTDNGKYMMLVTCGDSGDNDSIAKLYMLLKAVG